MAYGAVIVGGIAAGVSEISPVRPAENLYSVSNMIKLNTFSGVIPCKD